MHRTANRKRPREDETVRFSKRQHRRDCLPNLPRENSHTADTNDGDDVDSLMTLTYFHLSKHARRTSHLCDLPDVLIANIASFLRCSEHSTLSATHTRVRHALQLSMSWSPVLELNCSYFCSVSAWRCVLSSETREIRLSGDDTAAVGNDQSVISQTCRDVFESLSQVVSNRQSQLRHLRVIDLSQMRCKYLLMRVIDILRLLPSIRSLRLPMCKFSMTRYLHCIPANIQKLHIGFDSHTTAADLESLHRNKHLEQITLFLEAEAAPWSNQMARDIPHLELHVGCLRGIPTSIPITR